MSLAFQQLIQTVNGTPVRLDSFTDSRWRVVYLLTAAELIGELGLNDMDSFPLT